MNIVIYILGSIGLIFIARKIIKLIILRSSSTQHKRLLCRVTEFKKMVNYCNRNTYPDDPIWGTSTTAKAVEEKHTELQKSLDTAGVAPWKSRLFGIKKAYRG